MSDILATAPKPFCFVLMPFTSDFDDVYRLGIWEACEGAGAYCERVDEQVFDGSILERVYNQISKADVIIADMTGRNPNVFYEVGYAHALGKRTILLTKSVDDIPFDLKHFPHIVYGNSITSLRSDLRTRVQYFIDTPVGRAKASTIDIELYCGNVNLSDGHVIHEFDERKIPNCDVTIHNASALTFESGGFTIGIISGPDLPSCRRNDVVTTALPDGRYLHVLPYFATLFPNAFDSFWLGLDPSAAATNSTEYHITLRVFSPVGTRDFEMTLRRSAEKANE